MGFYSFRKSMWTATDADDASSSSVIGGEVSGNGRVDAADPASKLERDLIDHRKVCKAKPGNCPFEKKQQREIQALKNKDAGQAAQVMQPTEAKTAPVQTQKPMTVSVRPKCDKTLSDIAAYKEKTADWIDVLNEVDDVICCEFAFDSEKKSLAELRFKAKNERHWLDLHNGYLKEAMEKHDAAPNKYTERELVNSQSLAEAQILKCKDVLAQYKEAVHRTTVRKLKSVVNSPMCKSTKDYDMATSGNLDSMISKADTPAAREKFSELKKAFDKLSARRDKEIERFRGRAKVAVNALSNARDPEDFYGRLLSSLNVLEDVSSANDNYDRAKAYIENEIEDTNLRRVSMTTAERDEYASKWQSSMRHNAEGTVALYNKDGDSAKARDAAISAIDSVSRMSGKPISDEIKGIMSELNPKIVCTMANTIAKIEYSGTDEAYCDTDGRIVMSDENGYYNSAHTFFHEAGHAALHRFVKSTKRASVYGMRSTNADILTAITDSAAEEAGSLFQSWYGGRNLFGIGTNFRKREKSVYERIQRSVRDVVFGKNSEAQNNEVVERSSAAIGDIFCAVTQGNVGKGHSIEYFQQYLNTPLHEITADITAMHIMFPKITETLFPKTTRLVMGMVFGVTPDDEGEKKATFGVTKSPEGRVTAAN